MADNDSLIIYLLSFIIWLRHSADLDGPCPPAGGSGRAVPSYLYREHAGCERIPYWSGS